MERNAYFIMKIAVITGASSGMGREFVLQLSRREQFDEIWVIARRKERLEALKPLVHTPLPDVSTMSPGFAGRYVDRKRRKFRSPIRST